MKNRFPRSQLLLIAFAAACVVGCEPADSRTSSMVTSDRRPVSEVGKPEPARTEVAKTSDQKSTSEAAPHPVFYTVDHYDEARDPAADLHQAVARAKSEGKRVLVQVGGDWCGWCKLMTKFIDSDQEVSSILEKHYLLMKVTYTQNQPNEAFLSQYPKIKGYPHLFVIDADGKLLHSQDTGELEEGKGYSRKAFVEFLNAWKP